MEHSLGLLKPDCLKRRLEKEVIALLESSGLKIVAIKTVRLTRENVDAIWPSCRPMQFYDDMVEFSTSGDCSEVEHQIYWEWRNHENIYSIYDPTEVNGVLDHMALYASSEHLSKAAFLWSGETRPMNKSDFSTQDTSTIVERLKQHGIETAVLDLTPEYLKKAGVRVVRAIPLGLIPISFGYGMEPLGTARYRQTTRLGTPWPNSVPFTHPFG